MRDRLVTLLGALCALALVYSLFFKRPTEPPATRPQSVESGRNGYLGLKTWLERQDVRVESLRDRYARLLEDASLAPAGNLLIVTMPFLTPLRTSEVEPLERWTARGNTVLVLAALDDSPEWLPAADIASFQADLAALTRLRFAPTSVAEPGPRAARRPPQPNPFAPSPVASGTPIELEPTGEHPLTVGVASLRGFSDDTSDIWRVAQAGDSLVLRLARETSNGTDALWQIPRGDGQVVVSASGSLLANRNIGQGDARRLVRNLVRYHVERGGAVIFDDMHQGLSSLYDASALVRDPRLRSTIWFVLAAWLVYLLGASNRLAPPRAAPSAPRQADFLRAAGGFMARRLDRRAAARLLLDEWLAEVRRARGLPPGAAVWHELEATPTLDRGVYSALRGYDRDLEHGRAVDLVRLHNVLRQAREGIG